MDKFKNFKDLHPLKRLFIEVTELVSKLEISKLWSLEQDENKLSNLLILAVLNLERLRDISDSHPENIK